MIPTPNAIYSKGPLFLRVTFHFIVFLPIAFVTGLALEATAGNSLYGGTYVEPFAPFAMSVSAMLAIFTTRKLFDDAAVWVWIPGTLLFIVGVVELVRGWSSAWDKSGSALRYAALHLLTPNCGSTECLEQLLFTAPFVCSISYSVASFVTFRYLRQRRVPPPLAGGPV